MNNEMAKVAIVTGAAKNIGRATCESLSKLGYNILVHANTDKDGADETERISNFYICYMHRTSFLLAAKPTQAKTVASRFVTSRICCYMLLY